MVDSQWVFDSIARKERLPFDDYVLEAAKPVTADTPTKRKRLR